MAVSALIRRARRTGSDGGSPARLLGRGFGRRRLEYLAEAGLLALSLRYGVTGRPEHRYRAVGADSPNAR